MSRSAGSLELLATAYGYAGRGDDLRVLNELKRRSESSFVPAGALVNPYLALHDYNEAFCGSSGHARRSQAFCNS
jgi:hypothetical protein